MEEVLVIGGGLAGLSAGCELADRGHKITLVERKPYLGGRACSFFHRGVGEEVDIGQHVFMRCCSAYLNFLERIGAEDLVCLQPRLSVVVRSPDGRMGQIRGSSLPGALSLLPSLLRSPFLRGREKLDIGRAMLQILRTDRRREELTTTTVDDWLGLTARGAPVRRFFDFLILPTLNDHPENVSASMGLMVLKEAFLKSHGADIGYPRVGLSQLAAEAAYYIQERGGQVFLNRGAKSLLVEDGRLRGAELSDGQVLAVDFLISAIPPSALLKLLPREWREHPFFAQTEKLRWNPIVNLHLWLDRPVMDRDFIAFWDSPAQWIFNRSQISCRAGPGQHLSVSLSGAWRYIDMKPGQIFRLLLAELSQLLPRIPRAEVENYLVVKQREATISLAPGMEQYRLPHQTPLENLFLAGDWTDVGWPSTMEGAVRSGLACAREALTDRKC